MALGCAISAIGLAFHFSSFEKKLLDAAQRESHILAQSIALTTESVDSLETLGRYVSKISKNQHVVDIYIISGEPAVIIASSNHELQGKPIGVIPIEQERTDLMHTLVHRDTHYSVHREKLAVEAIVPAMFYGTNKSNSPQLAAVMVDLDYTERRSAYLNDFIYQCVILILIVISSGLSTIYFISRKVLRPLKSLREEINEDESLIKLEENEDEIKSLVRAYKQYAKSLKSKEHALKEALVQSQKLAQIAQRTNNSVIICDSEGKIEWVNPGFIKLTGYSAEEAIGRKPGSFLQGEESDPNTVDKIRTAVREKKPIQEDMLNYTKAGKAHWVRIEIEPLFDESGQVQSFIAIEFDISQEKAREAELTKAKEAAEALSKAKTDFLSTMSHEIRTPMNGIIGMLHLLETSDLDDEQTEFVNIANRSSNTMMSLIDNLLSFSKSYQVGIALEEIEFNLEDELKEVIDTTIEPARSKGLNYRLNIGEDVPRVLLGDTLRLNQLLTNLTCNAIKFTKQGSVSLDVQYCGHVSGQHRLKFIVSDTGIGVEEALLEKLFNPFTQAQTSTTREYGGSGLGLAICKQICEAMDSEIEVKSTLGKGSIFQVTLKFRAPEAI